MIASIGAAEPATWREAGAAAFCAAAVGLGERTRLLTLSAGSPGAGEVPKTEDYEVLELTGPGSLKAGLAEVRHLHLAAVPPLSEATMALLARAVATARSASATLSVSLAGPEQIIQHGRRRLTQELAALRPELLFASEAGDALLTAPLSELCVVPVVSIESGGLRVFDRQVPALHRLNSGGAALTAAFCVAYLEGATPLEAAGRAVLLGRAAASDGKRRPERALRGPA
ncbi:MAG: hypothetical protein ACR2MZ_04820 [Candidatus Dormibacter sp.]|uniref:hypothetical protein n=1 Tax=Candidatus Dormibacter sp. TaxID=2973982 RepID=UPI000DB54641|nr:MAG: hypothetical protein DLM66_05305 [Candidatus Dormibacteraeota bacterium]